MGSAHSLGDSIDNVFICFQIRKVSATIYYYMYLQQYGKYLEVDLIGSKATNRKHEKMVSPFSCLGRRLNPVPFSPESTALPSEPSHLEFHFVYFMGKNKLSHINPKFAFYRTLYRHSRLRREFPLPKGVSRIVRDLGNFVPIE